MAHRSGHPHPEEEVAARAAAVLDRLRADGGRLTTGRRAIVHALLASPDHHVTADELAASVQATHPDVHLSTVYRTLEALEVLGIVDRVALGAGGAVYHLTDRDHAHHHLLCQRCGAVAELDDRALDAMRRAVDRASGFRLSERLVLTGLCAGCAAEASEASERSESSSNP
jgi:Fe2+ or Zn2+ uptake regulation protein